MGYELIFREHLPYSKGLTYQIPTANSICQANSSLTNNPMQFRACIGRMHIYMLLLHTVTKCHKELCDRARLKHTSQKTRAFLLYASSYGRGREYGKRINKARRVEGQERVDQALMGLTVPVCTFLGMIHLQGSKQLISAISLAQLTHCSCWGLS